MLKESSASIRRSTAFIGMTTAARQAITVASMYHCQLQGLINRAIPLSGPKETMKQSYQYQVKLTMEAREELTCRF